MRTAVGTRIARQLKDLGVTQNEAARKLRRSQSWVSQSLLDRAEETLKDLWVKDPQFFEEIAALLNWSKDQLARLAGLPTESVAGDAPVPLERIVPVYPAGTGPAWDLSDSIDQVLLPIDILSEQPVIALKAMGDSMAPYLPRGAIAIVLVDDGAVKPGDFVAVHFSDDGVVVKRFVSEHDELLVLESLTPGHGEPAIFTAPIGSRVLGKVVRRLLDG